MGRKVERGGEKGVGAPCSTHDVTRDPHVLSLETELISIFLQQVKNDRRNCIKVFFPLWYGLFVILT